VSGSPTGGQGRSLAYGAHHPDTLIQQTHLRPPCGLHSSDFLLRTELWVPLFPLFAAENTKINKADEKPLRHAIQHTHLAGGGGALLPGDSTTSVAREDGADANFGRPLERPVSHILQMAFEEESYLKF
jgi:hypothetical protein